MLKYFCPLGEHDRIFGNRWTSWRVAVTVDQLWKEPNIVIAFIVVNWNPWQHFSLCFTLLRLGLLMAAVVCCGVHEKQFYLSEKPYTVYMVCVCVYRCVCAHNNCPLRVKWLDRDVQGDGRWKTDIVWQAHIQEGWSGPREGEDGAVVFISFGVKAEVIFSTPKGNWENFYVCVCVWLQKCFSEKTSVDRTGSFLNVWITVFIVKNKFKCFFFL